MTFTVDNYTFVGILAGKILKTNYIVLMNDVRIGELQLAQKRVHFAPLRSGDVSKAPAQDQIDRLLPQLLAAGKQAKAEREALLETK